MAVNALNAAVERRVKVVGKEPRGFSIPTFRSLRHGVPAATYDDQVRGTASVAREVADRVLFEDWGWA